MVSRGAGRGAWILRRGARTLGLVSASLMQQQIRLSSTAGFACHACHVSFKDSNSYIDHTHSQGHLQATHRSAKVPTATLEDVRQRIEQLAKERGLKD